MAKERIGVRPRDWLKRDPFIRQIHTQGYSAYKPGYRTEDLTASLNSPNSPYDWKIIVSKDTPSEQVPSEIQFKSTLKEVDLREEKLGMSTLVLRQRTQAWIAGYGVRAMEEGDLATAIMAIKEVAPTALKENIVLKFIVSRIVHGWLGLPKSKV